ncbi:uncharacterized protein T551_00239 [Pneumocystis jirovecii RU7]|uniref:rRNA-processing protein EFG1 n=1 Tax=Pneumocystis jirovecii (strain RU7) TaxID=1408657 RepID=A0A0W4ZWK4_PNEJ7|nr:uncharacterized protein T551_00239 [Pneumocystis jirovecii RU7]KTW32754.1 hypothetical protein T551_00239 [Pneumocystis jirovecii RU7]
MDLIKERTVKRKKCYKESSFGNFEIKGSSRLKKKIRDLERLIKKGTIPADVQIEMEREIQSLRFDLKNVHELKKKHALEGKYKMVRFFEKKKAFRRLKQAQKQLMEVYDENEKKKLQEIVHRCHVDLNYIIEFPSFKKYISLYKLSSENSSTAQERIMIWKNIEKKMELEGKMH